MLKGDVFVNQHFPVNTFSAFIDTFLNGENVTKEIREKAPHTYFLIPGYGAQGGKAGDIVLFDWNKNNSSDHIGIIEKKNSDGTYTTIEGNTSLTNNANGGQVMRRTRRQSEISWICRPKYTEKEDAKEKLVEDGEWGEATTRASQVVFGTIEDGEVSGQLISCKKYLPNCNTGSWEFVKSSKNGSTLIRAIQKLVGEKLDGKAGKNTAYKMQIFLKNISTK